MAKAKTPEPEITIESDRTVTVLFGRRRPTFAQVAAIAYGHGLSDYELSVRDSTSAYSFEASPSWVATFRLSQSL